MLRERSNPPLSSLSVAVCALAVSISASPLLAEDMMGFMPPGGKSILIDNLGADDGGKIAELAATEASNDEWKELLGQLMPDIEENALATVIAYSSINFPISKDALAQLEEAGAAEALPPDGKDLAVNNCQNCHSLFSGYLVHDRDVTGWLSTFKSPFHSEIPMTEIERETFSHYSAINMPMKFEDVPPEYRF